MNVGIIQDTGPLAAGLENSISKSRHVKRIFSFSGVDDLFESREKIDCGIVMITEQKFKQLKKNTGSYRRIQDGTRFILIGDFTGSLGYMISDAARYNVVGFLLNDCSENEIAEALEKAAKRQMYFSADLREDLISFFLQADNEKSAPAVLSAQERAIMIKICEGKSVKEIADILQLPANRIIYLKKALLKKINVKSTGGLLHYAIENKIIESLPEKLGNIRNLRTKPAEQKQIKKL